MKASGRFADLGLRLASSIVVGAVALTCIWLGGVWIAVLAGLAACAMMLELRAIVLNGGRLSSDAWLYCATIILAVGVAHFKTPLQGLIALAGGLGAAMLLDWAVHQRRGTGALNPKRAVISGAALIAALFGAIMGSEILLVAGTVGVLIFTVLYATGDRGTGIFWCVIGGLYIGAAAIAFLALRAAEPYGLLSILWAALVVIAADVGGYFAGRMIGGPKLWPAVSPKKTWAGLGGGVGLAFLVGGVFSWATTGTYFYQACVVSMVAAVVSQGGDLAESALKRQFQVKDASGLIPGHGGVLDRLDGHMAALLVAAAVTFWRGQAVFIW